MLLLVVLMVLMVLLAVVVVLLIHDRCALNTANYCDICTCSCCYSYC